MIFLNPWAWLGVLAIAAPVVAHFLGRRPARRLVFPTLRFLPATIPSPVRRDRLADVWLLVLRAAIIVGAAFALAQPVWLSSHRARELGSQIARAVIVDAGASMSRPTGRDMETSRPTGRDMAASRPARTDGRALDAAREQAAEAAGGATTSRIAEAAQPASAIAAAVTWLLTQPMRRELTLVSDFQTSALTRADLERVPAGIGVRLIKVPAAGVTPAEPAGNREVALLGGASEREGAAAALAAAIAQGAPALGRSDRPAAIVFPAFEARSALRERARPLDAPWMAGVLLSVANDPVVAAAAARIGRSALDLLAAAEDPDERGRLLLFVDTPPHTLFSAAVIGSVLNATAPRPSAAEAVTASYFLDELHGWEREPAEVEPAGGALDQSWSDGRWAWAATVALLLVETLVRRRRRTASETETHALVA